MDEELGKLRGMVAKSELEMKHDDTRDGIGELTAILKEMEAELHDMKEFVMKPALREEEKLAAEEIAQGLPKADTELQLIRTERDKLKKELDRVREMIKKAPKPRTF